MPPATPQAEEQTPPAGADRPTISTCEGPPGRIVFLESNNSDGWIASDRAVDVER